MYLQQQLQQFMIANYQYTRHRTIHLDQSSSPLHRLINYRSINFTILEEKKKENI